jgi:hypothetical protein
MTERPVSQIFQDILETIAYLEGFTDWVSVLLGRLQGSQLEDWEVEA